MLSNLLNAEYPKHVELGEVSLDALIGFIVVFIGILFLIFVVWLVGKFLTGVDGKEPKKVQEKVQERVAIPAEKPKEEDEISEETVAVIVAALTAYYQTNQPKCEFTVKRIKRI